MNHFRWPMVAIVALMARATFAAPATAPASTASDPELVGQVRQLVQQLADSDSDIRRAATVATRNLPGEAYDAVNAELQQPSLNADVRKVLQSVQPILRARQRCERRADAAAAWRQRTGIDAYERVGRKNPKWDDLARQGIRLAERPHLDPWRQTVEDDEVRAAFKKAIAAGGDDPLVLDLYAEKLTPAGVPREKLPDALHKQLDDLRKPAGDGMLKSDYPASRKCMGLALAGIAGHKDVDRFAVDALKLLPSAIMEPGIPPRQICEIALSVQEALDVAEDEDPQATKEAPEVRSARVFEVLTKALPGRPEPVVFKAQYYRRYASRHFNALPPFDEWATHAHELLQDAAKLDPDGDLVPITMLEIMKNQDYDRDEMERWFALAMRSNPDNMEACQIKLWYLTGHFQDMLAFGRQCRATENWRGRIPFVLIDAHQRIAQFSENPKQYLEQAAVWADIRSVYEPYLAILPTATHDRSVYAKLACTCKQWKDAKALFDVLGDQPDLGVFGNRVTYDFYRKKAARKIMEAERKPAKD